MVNPIYVTEGTPIAIFNVDGFNQLDSGAIQQSNSIPPPEVDTRSQEKYSFWGNNNQYPDEVVIAVAKNAALQQALQIKRDAHIGKGLIVYTEKVAQDGKTLDYKIVSDSRIDDFFGYSNLDTQYFSAADAHWLHFNYFPELIPSRDNKSIAAINFRDPHTCRVGIRNKKGLIEKLYLSYNWPYPNKTNEMTDIAAINIFDPIKSTIEKLAKGKSLYLPVHYNTRGRAHYNECYWHGLIAGWLSIGNAIPTAVRQLIKNQMVLKFHVQINYGYWEKKFKGWATLSQKEREEYVAAELTMMNTFLRDVDNYGKSLVSFFEYDPLNVKDIRKDIIIEPIKNQMEDLKYITEFQQSANAELLFGVGTDGTLIGQHSPGGSEAGSGSNKREAIWVLDQLLEPHRKLTIDPWWNVIKSVNKLPREWKLGVRKPESLVNNPNTSTPKPEKDATV